MNKIIVIIAILIGNGIIIPNTTNQNKNNQENTEITTQSNELETGGEDGHTPPGDDDD